MPRYNPTHARIAKDADVKRWHANVARGSLITADTYLRRVGAFCEWSKLEPAGIIKLGEKKRHDLLLDFVSGEEKRGCAGSYIDSSLKAVKSWLMHNGIRLTRPIRIQGVKDTPTLRDERTPTQDELGRIFRAAIDMRDRVSSVLMAHSGVRPQVLGNYRGTDGLRISDFPEMLVKENEVKFEVVPTLVVVRSELSKTEHKYFTFLGEEGCQYLKEYLESRMRGGEKLGPGSDVIHAKPRSNKEEGFVTTIRASTGVKSAILKAGFKWRPYVLRAYFDTQLLLAESRGKLAHDYRIFWMGHTGSMDARYTTNKGRLPKDLIEDMRQAYARCEPFLSTAPTKKQAQSQTDVARVMLLGMGYSEKELEDKDLEDIALLQELVRKKWQQGPPAPKKQKVVDMQELPAYLEANWRFVAAVGNEKAILDPPHGGAA